MTDPKSWPTRAIRIDQEVFETIQEEARKLLEQGKQPRRGLHFSPNEVLRHLLIEEEQGLDES